MSLDNQEAPLTIRHWLLRTIITSGIICAVFLGLGFLFLPDGVLNKGPSPAISAEQEYHDTQALQQRIAALEQRLQNQIQAQALQQENQTVSSQESLDTYRATSDLELQESDHANEQLQRVSAEAKEYEARLQKLQEESAQESLVARMMFGAIQLKNAYTNEESLAHSVAILKQTVSDEHVQEKLTQLDQMIQENLPTRQDILTYIHQLQDNLTTQNISAPLAQNDQQGWMESLKDRTKNLAGQFIQIHPTEKIQQAKTLDRIADAVTISDYSLAAQLTEYLPENPKTHILMTQLKTRAKAQSLMHGVVSGVSNLVRNPNRKGALY